MEVLHDWVYPVLLTVSFVSVFSFLATLLSSLRTTFSLRIVQYRNWHIVWLVRAFASAVVAVAALIAQEHWTDVSYEDVHPGVHIIAALSAVAVVAQTRGGTANLAVFLLRFVEPSIDETQGRVLRWLIKFLSAVGEWERPILDRSIQELIRDRKLRYITAAADSGGDASDAALAEMLAECLGWSQTEQRFRLFLRSHAHLLMPYGEYPYDQASAIQVYIAAVCKQMGQEYPPENEESASIGLTQEMTIADPGYALSLLEHVCKQHYNEWLTESGRTQQQLGNEDPGDT